MSKIGNIPIVLTSEVQVEKEQGRIKVVGPKGEIFVPLKGSIEMRMEDGKLILSRKSDLKKIKALHGLARSLVASAIKGVTEGYSKTLELVGVGFRAAVQEDTLTLQVGYSHPVIIKIPEGIKISVFENKVKVEGIDKQLVGEISAKIRLVRVPEPYKGKGIKYSDETIRRKVGKAVKAQTG